MATPTLRSLREFYGHKTRLVGIVRPYVQDVLGGTDWLDDLIPYDRRAEDPNLRTWSLVRRLCSEQFDSVILLTNSMRAAAIARVCRIPQRIGYVRYGRGPLLTERLYPPRTGLRLTPISAVDYYLHLAQAVGATVESRRPELGTLAADDRRAEAIWRKFGIDENRPVVVLNTGAAYGSAKEWPPEYFALLSRRIVQDLGGQVIVICGPLERETADQIVNVAGSNQVKSLSSENVSIGLSKSIVKRSQLLVSTDSGPRHFGAAFDVPTITLFGPTDPRWSENYQRSGVHLQKDVPCGPCAARTCPLGHHRCMRELTVEQVFGAATLLLNSPLERRTVA